MVTVWVHDPWLCVRELLPFGHPLAATRTIPLWGSAQGLLTHTDDSAVGQCSGLTDQRGTGGSRP